MMTLLAWIAQQNEPGGRRTDHAESRAELVAHLRRLVAKHGAPNAVTLDLWYDGTYHAIHLDAAVWQNILGERI